MKWLKRIFAAMQDLTRPTITVEVDTEAIKAQVRDARLFTDYALSQPSASDIETACKIIRNLANRLDEITGGQK